MSIRATGKSEQANRKQSPHGRIAKDLAMGFLFLTTFITLSTYATWQIVGDMSWAPPLLDKAVGILEFVIGGLAILLGIGFFAFCVFFFANLFTKAK